MRTCWDCQQAKPLADFYVGVKRCRACCVAAWGSLLTDGTHRITRKTRGKWRGQHKELIAMAKDRPCMDCGGRFPAVAMDFDHRNRSTKVAKVSDLRGASMMDEIAKCDLVCANCHRVRTWLRGDHMALPGV